MTSLHARTRRWASIAFALCMAMLVVPGASAQTAASVMAEAQKRMQSMFEGVEHYKMKTDMFTTYTRKVERNGEVETETATVMTSEDGSESSLGGSSSSPFTQFEAIGQHGTYLGTETVHGISCHVIQVDDPSKIESGFTGQETVTYYIGTEDYLMHRMKMEGIEGQSGGSFAVDMRDYRTYDQGLKLPSRMEMSTLKQSAEMQRRMAELKKQLEQMPEAQRKRMEKMMGNQMDQIEGMASGKPMVIEVEEVVVNGPLPKGVFGGS